MLTIDEGEVGVCGKAAPVEILALHFDYEACWHGTCRLATGRERKDAMTIDELDNYLGTRGMQLGYVRRVPGYHWVVNQVSDDVQVCEGIDIDERAMIGHILGTPLPRSQVLIGQMPFDFGPAGLPAAKGNASSATSATIWPAARATGQQTGR
jgi:hypothetical protein